MAQLDQTKALTMEDEQLILSETNSMVFGGNEDIAKLSWSYDQLQFEKTPNEGLKFEKPYHEKSIRLRLNMILQIIIPLANGFVRGIRGFQQIWLTSLQNISFNRRMLTNLLAFTANTISMNLSTVQVSHRIELFYNFIKIPRRRMKLNSEVPYSCSPVIRVPTRLLPTFQEQPVEVGLAAKRAHSCCCTLNVLAKPPENEPICADIVFIHGLHGSLVNTWKQGLWEKDRHPISFKRAPGPPIRPPKRPKNSRTVLHPPHKKKRIRLSSSHLPDTILHDDSVDLTDEGNDGVAFVNGMQICSGLDNLSQFKFRIRANETFATQAQALNSNECNTSSDYSKCWPGDWLPLDCPGVRVIALNYTTDQYLWRPIWKRKEPRSNIIQRAREMSKLLIEHRVGVNHPIVWVGHSKGGLFVKQIIVDAWESGDVHMENLWRSSKGCFFYSVPHRGSALASIKAPFMARSIELIEIERNNKYLQDLHRRFAALYHLGHLKIEIFSFVEMALTLMSILYVRIVGVDSADPGIGEVCGIRLDHREICKPKSRECILYKELVKMIKKNV